MSIQQNINNLLDKNFENNSYLPKKLFLEDLDSGTFRYIKNINLSAEDENNNDRLVPLIYLTQERWAEFRNNWKYLRDESGEQITMPFMTIRRINVKQGEHPIKRTIPVKKKFAFLKMPIFDGNLKGFDIYKIPQPPRVDIEYELRFHSHYMQDVNKSYEKMIADGFSDGQGYIKINGYDIPIHLGATSEDNTVDDITAERRFQIIFSLNVYGKIVDPTKFEKVKGITKILINITER